MQCVTLKTEGRDEDATISAPFVGRATSRAPQEGSSTLEATSSGTSMLYFVLFPSRAKCPWDSLVAPFSTYLHAFQQPTFCTVRLVFCRTTSSVVVETGLDEFLFGSDLLRVCLLQHQGAANPLADSLAWCPPCSQRCPGHWELEEQLGWPTEQDRTTIPDDDEDDDYDVRCRWCGVGDNASCG